MSKSNVGEEFQRDTVRQITESGYPVAEVSQWLGVSQHSLYKWKKKFAASNDEGTERDILNKAAAYCAKDAW